MTKKNFVQLNDNIVIYFNDVLNEWRKRHDHCYPLWFHIQPNADFKTIHVFHFVVTDVFSLTFFCYYFDLYIGYLKNGLIRFGTWALGIGYCGFVELYFASNFLNLFFCTFVSFFGLIAVTLTYLIAVKCPNCFYFGNLSTFLLHIRMTVLIARSFSGALSYMQILLAHLKRIQF